MLHSFGFVRSSTNLKFKPFCLSSPLSSLWSANKLFAIFIVEILIPLICQASKQSISTWNLISRNYADPLMHTIVRHLECERKKECEKSRRVSAEAINCVGGEVRSLRCAIYYIIIINCIRLLSLVHNILSFLQQSITRYGPLLLANSLPFPISYDVIYLQGARVHNGSQLQ